MAVVRPAAPAPATRMSDRMVMRLMYAKPACQTSASPQRLALFCMKLKLENQRAPYDAFGPNGGKQAMTQVGTPSFEISAKFTSPTSAATPENASGAVYQATVSGGAGQGIFSLVSDAGAGGDSQLFTIDPATGDLRIAATVLKFGKTTAYAEVSVTLAEGSELVARAATEWAF